MGIEKWNTIFKLKTKTNSTADIFLEGDWICTDFGFMIDGCKDMIFVMQPLQIHPYGKDFGFAPTGLSCYMVTKEDLHKIFKVQEDKTYREIQKKYENDSKSFDCGKYTNSELWQMVEENKVEKWSVFEDTEGNQIIFTGKSFQLYYSEIDESKKYIGMCLGDLWEFIGVEEELINE